MTSHIPVSLAAGVVVDDVGEECVVYLPHTQQVLRLSGELATSLRGIRDGHGGHTKSSELSRLIDLGVVTTSAGMTRRSVVRGVAVAAGAGVVALSMPSVAAASSGQGFLLSPTIRISGLSLFLIGPDIDNMIVQFLGLVFDGGPSDGFDPIEVTGIPNGTPAILTLGGGRVIVGFAFNDATKNFESPGDMEDRAIPASEARDTVGGIDLTHELRFVVEGVTYVFFFTLFAADPMFREPFPVRSQPPL